MPLRLNSEIYPLAPKHDNRHALEPSELARESLAFLLQAPQHGIGGFLYTWVNGAGRAGAALCLYGPGIGDEPLFELCDGIEVSRDADFFDWQVGGLTLQLEELLHTATVTWRSERVEVLYRFTSIHPAYACSSHPNGCPDWMAADRFEQQGFIRGFITLGDLRIEFDGYGQRDHSWGMRDWGVNQHWKWVHAQAGDDLGVHFWKLFALGVISQ